MLVSLTGWTRKTAPLVVIPDIALSGQAVDNGAAIGTVVGVFTVSHGFGNFNYTLTNPGAGSYFEIVDLLDGTAELRVILAPEFAVNPSVNITVQAENAYDDTVIESFTITVNDVAGVADGTLDFSSVEGNPLV